MAERVEAFSDLKNAVGGWLPEVVVPVVGCLIGWVWTRKKKPDDQTGAQSFHARDTTATNSPGAVQNVQAAGAVTIYAPPHLAVPAADAVAAYNKLIATLERNASLEREVEAERGKSAAEQANAHAERVRAQELAERAKGLEEQLTQTFSALALLKEQNPAKAVRIEEAIEALEAGETAKAEAIFKRVFEDRKAVGDAAHQDAAAARHLGALAFMNDPKSALVWYRHATALEPDDPGGWNRLGVLLHRTGELTEAAAAFERVLVLGERRSKRAWIATAAGNLGLIALDRGDLLRAEEFYYKALAIAEDVDDKQAIATIFSNLGLIAKAHGDLPLAEEYSRKALVLAEELGDKEGLAMRYSNLGAIAQNRGDLPLADEYHRKAKVLNEELGRKEGVAIYYCNLGLIAQDRGDMPLAEECHRKSLILAKELGHKDGMATQYANLGFIYEDRHDLVQARAHWQQALALYREIGMPPMVERVEGWLRGLDGAPAP